MGHRILSRGGTGHRTRRGLNEDRLRRPEQAAGTVLVPPRASEADRVLVEPLVHKVKPGDTIKATLVVENPLAVAKKLSVHIDGFEKKWELDVPRGGTMRREFTQTLPRDLAAGRHVYPLRVLDGDRLDPVDAFVVVDVEANGQ